MHPMAHSLLSLNADCIYNILELLDARSILNARLTSRDLLGHCDSHFRRSLQTVAVQVHTASFQLLKDISRSTYASVPRELILVILAFDENSDKDYIETPDQTLDQRDYKSRSEAWKKLNACLEIQEWLLKSGRCTKYLSNLLRALPSCTTIRVINYDKARKEQQSLPYPLPLGFRSMPIDVDYQYGSGALGLAALVAVTAAADLGSRISTIDLMGQRVSSWQWPGIDISDLQICEDTMSNMYDLLNGLQCLRVRLILRQRKHYKHFAALLMHTIHLETLSMAFPTPDASILFSSIQNLPNSIRTLSLGGLDTDAQKLWKILESTGQLRHLSLCQISLKTRSEWRTIMRYIQTRSLRYLSLHYLSYGPSRRGLVSTDHNWDDVIVPILGGMISNLFLTRLREDLEARFHCRLEQIGMCACSRG